MDDSLSPLSALTKAVAHMRSQTKFGRLCGVSQPAVSGWINESGRLPAEHVLKVEAATGISRHDLRPDIYPRDASSVLLPDVAQGGAGGSSTGTGAAHRSSDPLAGFAA